MKLIYFANTRLPTEKARGLQIMKSCEAFLKNGVDIELIVPSGRPPTKGDPFRYYGLKNPFPIKKVFNINPTFLKSEKIIFYTRSLSFAFFSAIHFLFSKKDFIAYSRDLSTLLLLTLVGANPIAEIHDYRHSKPKRFVRYVLNKSKKIVVNSEGTKKAILDIYDIPISKILVVSNGVDTEFFDIPENKMEARKKLNIPLDKNVIAYVGRLETIGQEKGISDLIKAFRILNNKDNFLYIVGGPSDYVKKYKEEAKDISNIVFTGQVEYEKTPLYLRAVDILVIPSPQSQHSKTTSPIKLFEYMAAGKAIVASDLPAFRSYLNNDNAIFFESENPKDLSSKLNYVLENTKRARIIGERALIDSKKYLWLNRAKKIINFIS